MIAVVAENEKHLSWLDPALRPHAWSRLETLSVPASSEALIIIVDDLTIPRKVEQLKNLRSSASVEPVLVCTRFDRESTRLVGELRPDSVVWLDDSPVLVAETLKQLLSIPARSRLARAIERAGTLSPSLANAIVRGLKADKPPTTVKGLAHMAACDPSALQRRWVREILPATGMMPHRFVQWLLILHGHERRSRGMSWPAAAPEICVDIKTLRSAARYTLRKTLREVAGMSAGGLAHAIEVQLHASYSNNSCARDFPPSRRNLVLHRLPRS